MTTWTAADVRAFLDHVRDHRLSALFLLLATTGMRRGEALGLRWVDVDLDAARVSIVQTAICVHHEVPIGSPKTAKGRRTVALDSGTVAALKAHRRRQAAERLLTGAGFDDHGLVFCRPEGGPLHPERFSRMFDREIAKTTLPRIRLHDLRTPGRPWRSARACTRRWSKSGSGTPPSEHPRRLFRRHGWPARRRRGAGRQAG